jgi:alkanesulfonate monooxygenase SsuD/methylene tetrahydromethanopterin reductase-like flavin-dependent oxidoreductase (luciferase family)
LVVVGDEDTVAAGLRRYLDAGATEITLSHTDLAGEADRVRTWRLAGELANS